MNLIFRFLLVLLRASRGPKLGPLDTSVLRFRVLPNDLDFNFHMNNGRYLTLMDLGRVDLMLRAGMAAEIRRRRWLPVVASVMVRYRRSLGVFQSFELHTRLLGWDERWFFMEQRFTRGGELVAHAVVKAQFTAPGGRVTPRMVVDASPYDMPSPPLPDAVREWQESEETLVRGEPARVAYERA